MKNITLNLAREESDQNQINHFLIYLKYKGMVMYL